MSSSETTFDSEDVAKNKVFAILAYIWILFLVPLFAAKDSKFARYHAYQGVALFVTWVVVGVLDRLLPYSLNGIGWLLSVGLLVLMVMGIINAAQGHGRPLPLIGGFLKPDR